MGAIKSLAQGFLVATGIVWMFNVVALIRGGDPWLGMLYLLILILAASSIALLKLYPTAQTEKANPHKWHNLLFAFQGVALAFWSLDLITTFYAINITGLAIELNPLGWPMGILGALAFYGPVLAFSYVLLFRLKAKISLYAALPLTLLTLGMASMNLVAGAQNFQVFVDTAMLASGLRFGLFAVVLTLNFAVPLSLRYMLLQAKPRLNPMGCKNQP